MKDCVVSDAEMGESVLRVGVEVLIRVAGFDVLEIELVHANLRARWKGVVLLQLVLTGQKTLESRNGHGGWGVLLLSSARERAASSTKNGSEDVVTTIHEAKQANGLNGQVGSGLSAMEISTS